MNREDNKQLPLFGDKRDKTESKKHNIKDESSPFSKYVVYVDESGDHNLKNIDENYPLFVLAFCVFHKIHYSEKVVAALEKFKFNHFGHDQVILHEHEIRKEKAPFNIFKGPQQRDLFYNELTSIIEYSNFILISCVIDKRRLKSTGEKTQNPYHVALSYCLEQFYEFLKEKNQHNLVSHVVVECRGNKEDRELELEFRRICDGQNKFNFKLPFDVIFSDKKAMSSGLQFADLVARPIGLHVLRKYQKNRAFEVLKEKFYCKGGRENLGNEYEGKGLIIYPPLKSEKLR